MVWRPESDHTVDMCCPSAILNVVAGDHSAHGVSDQHDLVNFQFDAQFIDLFYQALSQGLHVAPRRGAETYRLKVAGRAQAELQPEKTAAVLEQPMQKNNRWTPGLPGFR